ncbi:antifreeze protein Maxi-like [Eurosta solidaginis]|uniref:antifreeze protein Maxi-like n=1 Tax=Eurosta solidaginis TaxID=178769 RepID=UPI003530D713
MKEMHNTRSNIKAAVSGSAIQSNKAGQKPADVKNVTAASVCSFPEASSASAATDATSVHTAATTNSAAATTNSTAVATTTTAANIINFAAVATITDGSTTTTATTTNSAAVSTTTTNAIPNAITFPTAVSATNRAIVAASPEIDAGDGSFMFNVDRVTPGVSVPAVSYNATQMVPSDEVNHLQQQLKMFKLKRELAELQSLVPQPDIHSEIRLRKFIHFEELDAAVPKFDIFKWFLLFEDYADANNFNERHKCLALR